MAPTWYAFIVIVFIVVVFYLLSNTAKQRRKESVSADFGKMPDFHANQVFTDIKGETALGIDDRGRRIAVARKHAQPRTKFYSFSHIISAEILQNGRVTVTIAKEQASSGPGGAPAGGGARPDAGTAAAGGDQVEGDGPAQAGAATPGPSEALAVEGSLFGSTARKVAAPPVIDVLRGEPLASLAMRLTLEDPADPILIVRFYEGRAIDVRSTAADKAYGDARTCLQGVDVAIKRAALPPRPAISGSGLGPRA
jgi:hypothetical protein